MRKMALAWMTSPLQVPCHQLAVVGVVKADQPGHVQLMSSEICLASFIFESPLT
jgi:hypothetical protein